MSDLIKHHQPTSVIGITESWQDDNYTKTMNGFRGCFVGIFLILRTMVCILLHLQDCQVRGSTLGGFKATWKGKGALNCSDFYGTTEAHCPNKLQRRLSTATEVYIK